MEKPILTAKEVLQAVEVVSADRYNVLVEDLKDILTEGVFSSRLELVKAKWRIGWRIMVEFETAGIKEVGTIINRLAADLKTSGSELYRCTEFYSKFLLDHKCKTLENVLEMLPEGKNISWFKIKTHYLPDLPMAKIPYIIPMMEMQDEKFGLLKWWAQNEDRNFTLILADKDNYDFKLQVKLVRNPKLKTTPLKELFKEIGSHYIQLKKWDVKDLDASDYARMNRSIKRLLIKAKGDKEKVKRAINWCNNKYGTEFEWTLNTAESKYAESQRIIPEYEKYLKKRHK